jgi:hypothetical protein
MEYRETLVILDKIKSNLTTKTIDEIIAEEFPNSLIELDEREKPVTIQED